MKVETPQLRWHQIINPQSKKDAGANGPILSCSLLSINDTAGVLATAGNTEVNLWRVKFTDNAARVSSSSPPTTTATTTTKNNNDGQQQQRSSSSSSHILVQPQTKNANTSIDLTSSNTTKQQELSEHTKIEHIVTLSRGTNERGINAVKFSPSGLHLVAAGDGGNVVVWSVPPTEGSSSFWSTMDKETDAPMKILFNQSDDIMDVAWSPDSKRFTVCSLDHTLTVWEQTSGNGAGVGQGEWRNVHRSGNDHTHYIQGVAYDPKGVYLASMGSDRMVKVYSRKNVKENAIKAELAKYSVDTLVADVDDAGEVEREREEQDKKAILQSKVLPELLTNSTFALQDKAKTAKFLYSKHAATNTSISEDVKSNEKDPSTPSSPTPNNTSIKKRYHMFVDELTLGSFFRRLAFTTDGAFLVVPAALWHGKGDKSSWASTKDPPMSPTSVARNEDKLAESSFATYLFARHHFKKPYKVLTGLDKPSVVVRPNPILFKLPPNAKSSANTTLLPYRSVFAVLTADTVLLYDTYHNHPLAMARGLHYAGLTDATWSTDGRTLFVTSSDGYVSILSFGAGELGDVYAPKVRILNKVTEKVDAASEVGESKVASTAQSICSKQPGSDPVTINTLVPKKKKKKIAPIPVIATADSDGNNEQKVTFTAPAHERSDQLEPSQPMINTLVPKKKKKKIAPTLITPMIQTQQPRNSVEEGVETSSVEKKRPAEEEAAPSTEVRELPVHILIPKKKKKVGTSSTPVATM